jgi:hypothetical protein
MGGILDILKETLAEVKLMRKNKKKSFDELVLENKQQLLQDQEALERIEERWEQRILEKLD